MFLRIVGESLRRRKRRKTIAAVSVALGVVVSTAMLSLSLSVGDRMNEEFAAYGANIVLEPAGDDLPLDVFGVDLRFTRARPLLDSRDVPKLKGLFWKNQLVGAAPMLSAAGSLDGTPAVVEGCYFDRDVEVGPKEKPWRTGLRQVHPSFAIEGRWPDEHEPGGSSEVLVGRSLARALSLRAGDAASLRLGAADVPVVVSGILSSGGPEDGRVYAPLETVSRLVGQPGKADRVEILAVTSPEDKLAEKMRKDPSSLTLADAERFACTPYPRSVAAQCETAFDGAVGKVVRQVAATQGIVLGRIRFLLLAISVAAMAGAALSVLSTLSTAVLDRRGEIGLFKALGATDGTVLRLFLAEYAAIGIAGGLAGFFAGGVLGDLLARRVFGAAIGRPGAALLPVALAAAVAIALLGSALPLRRALRVDPAQVLRGE